MAFEGKTGMKTLRSRGSAVAGGGSKPTGAAAFVARQKGGGRLGLTLATVGAVSLGAVLGAWALSDQAPEPKNGAGVPGSAVTSATDRRTDPEVERRKRSEEQAALARQRERQASEIAESRKQIEALQKRRDELQQQVAELTAPLAPDPDDVESATRDLNAAKAQAERPEAIAPGALKPLADEKRSDDASPPEPVAAAATSAPPPPAPTSRAQVDVVAAPATEVDVSAQAKPNGQVRVFIHVRARDNQARVRAQALADDLRRRGVEVAGIRGVPHAVRNDMVRFFYDADEDAVTTLGQALENAPGRGAPITQDFRNRRVAPKPGTLEIWLS